MMNNFRYVQFVMLNSFQHLVKLMVMRSRNSERVFAESRTDKFGMTKTYFSTTFQKLGTFLELRLSYKIRPVIKEISSDVKTVSIIMCHISHSGLDPESRFQTLLDSRLHGNDETR